MPVLTVMFTVVARSIVNAIGRRITTLFLTSVPLCFYFQLTSLGTRLRVVLMMIIAAFVTNATMLSARVVGMSPSRN